MDHWQKPIVIIYGASAANLNYLQKMKTKSNRSKRKKQINCVVNKSWLKSWYICA